MAASPDLPDEEHVRQLTADPNLTADDAVRYGNQFLDAGKFAEALMFFERNKDSKSLDRLKTEAIKTGDAFVLQGIVRLDPNAVPDVEWRQCGDEAMRQQKYVFARDCYQKSGDEEKSQAAYAEWLKIFPQAPPTPPTPA